MNILDTIIAHKYKEVEERKSLQSTKSLEKSLYFSAQTFSLKQFLPRSDKSGIIAEIKRKSPSKGIINSSVSIEQTSIGYIQAGASALSILTDKEFFGGSNDDLLVARMVNACPILRKDFVVDEYQIIEAKSIGADAILLIAASLSPDQIIQFTKVAKSLSLEVILEIHNEEELKRNLGAEVDIIGVNNRNLKTFEVDINLSKELSPLIPNDILKISESGISSVVTIKDLREYGYQGFLMGENFMKHTKPEQAAKEFIHSLMTSV
jgi:indole-3-glycerol phosphate synthase